MLEFDMENNQFAVIKVIGVGVEAVTLLTG